MQRSGHDADIIIGIGTPEEARTAPLAEPAGRKFGGGEPFKRFVGDNHQRILRNESGCHEVAAGPPALAAVAIHDGLQWSYDAAAHAGAMLETHWDYIIVGAGTAGLPAAIHASRRGASVLMLDAADSLGGTLNMASGQISAGGTRLQDAKGIADSPDRHYEDIMEITYGEADPYIIRRTVDNAPGTLNWLLDNGLVPLPDHPLTGAAPGRPGYSVPRYFWGEAAGKAILKVVLEELDRELPQGNIAIRLNTRVTGLLTSDSGRRGRSASV